jgi:hypothetical protein
MQPAVLSSQTAAADAGAPERRRFARRAVAMPCKVFRPLTRRYIGARTRDTSRGGALLEVDGPCPLAVGEAVRVGIAWTRGPLIAEESLMEGMVVRVDGTGADRRGVAIRFGEPAGEFMEG